MTETSDKPFSSQEKVQILLQEYNTLRQEIIQRTNQGFQIYGVGAVFFVLLMGRSSYDQKFWIMLCIALIALLIASKISISGIGKAAKRLWELENAINGLAGEDLLVWEGQRGGFANGPWWFWGSARPKKQILVNIAPPEPKPPIDARGQ
jgi:hypothetical protein